MSPALHSVLIHRSKWLVLCWLALAGSVCLATESRSLVVASKRFTESYLLAEIISQTLEVKASARVERKPGLGNTAILFGALQQGKIDVYPEYVGTITKEILKEEQELTIGQINERLSVWGLRAEVLLGFNNSYAFAMQTKRNNSTSQALVTSISFLSFVLDYHTSF